MEEFKKIISLNQAAEFSGYSQDYLGSLIRKGEIKGLKKGRAWFTTEKEVENYLLKKKALSNKSTIKNFFSPTCIRNIIIVALIVFIGVFLLMPNFNKSKPNPADEIKYGMGRIKN